MTPTNSAAGRIPSLDGLRAISIALVLVGHLAGSRFFPLESSIQQFVDLGSLGVRVFFVLSGFLITSLLMNEHRDSGRISLRTFYFRRTLRIFPAFYLFLLLMDLVAHTHAIAFKPGDMVHAATYTINYHYDRSWWLGHLWSLSVEEQFYVLWPVVIAVTGMRRAMNTAMAAVFLCPVIRLSLLLLYPGRYASMDESFPTVADAIAAGCLLAGFREYFAMQGWYRALLHSRWFNLVPALAFSLNCSRGGRLRVALLSSLINLCIALTVDRYVHLPGTIIGRFLNLRPIAYVGALSYSIYLWQQPFVRHGQSIAPFPVNLLLALGAAWMSYKFVEGPFLNLRKRLERYIVKPPLAPSWQPAAVEPQP